MPGCCIKWLLYSTFLQELKTAYVKEITIGSNQIRGTLRNAQQDGKKPFVTTRVESHLARDVAQYNVRFTGVLENAFFTQLLGWSMPAAQLFRNYYARYCGTHQCIGGGHPCQSTPAAGAVCVPPTEKGNIDRGNLDGMRTTQAVAA